MKNLVLYVSLIIYSNTFAQEGLEKFMTGKGLSFDGEMILLHDSTFIAETEVNYRDYLAFENQLSKGPIDTLSSISYLNELSWDFRNEKAMFIRSFRSLDSTYDQTSFHNALFFRGPALAITYEQAKLFCEWMSNLHTRHFNKKLIQRGDSLRVTYHFRLPTESEWRLACGDITQYHKKVPYGKLTKWGLRKMKIKNREGTVIDLTVKQSLHSTKNYAIYQEDVNFVGSVYAHEKNNNHCFNMLGNVAEMVDEKGVAMGGSWHDNYDEIMAKNLRMSYTCPEYWLGFRYACDISFTYHTYPDTLLRYEVPVLTDSCIVVHKRHSVIQDRRNQNDPDYLERKIKEWVRKDKAIPLTDEVVYINDSPTSSFEAILLDSVPITVRIPSPFDSVQVIQAIYIGHDTLVPRQVTKQKKSEFLVYPIKDLVHGLLINLYYQGNRRTFFRVVKHQ